jgi:hypothetical protein
MSCRTSLLEAVSTTPTDFYAGFTNLKLLPEWDEYELGEGLVFRRTFAHLMSSHTMAFNPPESPGAHHPAPWKATSQFESFDIHTELLIPASYKPPVGLSHYDVARTITIMMRLFCDARIRFLVESTHSLSVISTVPDKEMLIVPIEASRQFVELELAGQDAVSSAGRLYWVHNNWQNAVHLMASHADFRLAMEAFEMSTFIPHHALTLVSLWGALEALFSPSTSELRFRVSILIASYIYPPGQQRAEMQKEIFELYDKRSAAAHGKPKHNTDHLMQTFNILQLVLMRMIGENEVPSKTALNNMLLGVD